MAEFDDLVSVVEDDKQSSYKRKQALTDLIKNFKDEEKTFSVLEKVFQTNDSFMLREAVSSFKNIEASEQHLVILRGLLDKDDDYLKKDVIQILGDSGNASDLEMIKAYTEESSYSVSYAAKQALEKLEERLAHVEEVVEPEVVVVEAPEIFEEEPEAVLEETSEPELIAEEASVIDEDPIVHKVSKTVETSAETEKPQEDLRNEKRESLHDNSIFKDKTISAVYQEYEKESTVEFSEQVPAFFTNSTTVNESALKKFFGSSFQSALALYNQLDSHQQQLPSLENKLSEIRRQLTFLEADKADDVELSETTVKDTAKDTEELKWQIKKCEVDLKDIETENNSFFKSFFNSLSQDKQEKIDSEKRELEKTLKSLKEELDESEMSLLEDQTEVQQLMQPFLVLQKELETAEHARDSCLEKLSSVDQEINNHYVRYVFETEELEKSLNFLGAKTPVFESILKKLSVLKVQIEQSESLLEIENVKLKSAKDSTLEKINALGSAIEKGFQTVKRPNKTKVDIRANIGFKEESSFFGGYSNASGTANGSGMATLQYDIVDTTWMEVAELPSRLEAYESGFSELGQLSGKIELIDKTCRSQQIQFRQYVDYIRLMVESANG
ncbi:MAG: hypothetical protein NE334_15420 [Lentisphaeraceae bacterium]|nr:hypothetical protein [Lentisphaeraceae bacterium]